MAANNKKILVGLSGGVDSATAVLLLKRQGFEVITAAICFSNASKAALSDAKKLSKELGVQHYEIDMQRRFSEIILENFCKVYTQGGTPNPCILCNPCVKFYALTQLADKLCIEKIATGHYADVCEYNNYYVLKMAQNPKKDQSYMLYRLPQEILKRVIFPLSRFEKKEIRNIAGENLLSNAEKPDSQELCFVEDGDYIHFLTDKGFTPKKGNFILPCGKRVPHSGSYCYTVGQRRGIAVSYFYPLYVKEIMNNGDISLCDKQGVMKSEVVANDFVQNPAFSINHGDMFTAKIRSTSPLQECKIISFDKDKIKVQFHSPVFAPAKGQSLVLYKDSFVVGGGIIC